MCNDDAIVDALGGLNKPASDMQSMEMLLSNQLDWGWISYWTIVTNQTFLESQTFWKTGTNLSIDIMLQNIITYCF